PRPRFNRARLSFNLLPGSPWPRSELTRNAHFQPLEFRTRKLPKGLRLERTKKLAERPMPGIGRGGEQQQRGPLTNEVGQAGRLRLQSAGFEEGRASFEVKEWRDA